MSEVKYSLDGVNFMHKKRLLDSKMWKWKTMYNGSQIMERLRKGREHQQTVKQCPIT